MFPRVPLYNLLLIICIPFIIIFRSDLLSGYIYANVYISEGFTSFVVLLYIERFTCVKVPTSCDDR